MSASGSLKYAKEGNKTSSRREYTEVWRVRSTTTTTTVKDILEASGLPSGDATYTGDSGAFVQGLKASRIDKEGLEWEVVVDYAGGKDVMSLSLDHKVYRYAGEPMEEVAASGWNASGNGVAIRNSAGDPFQPPLMASKTLLAITVKGTTDETNVSTFNGFITDYMNTVNNSEATINGTTYPSGTLLLRSIAPEPPYDSRMAYTIQVVYKKDTWIQPVVDAGFRAVFTGSMTGYTGDGGLREVHVSDVQSGIPPKSTKDVILGSPVLLNGSGNFVGSKWPYDPTQDPVYLKFYANEPKSWSALSGYL